MTMPRDAAEAVREQFTFLSPAGCNRLRAYVALLEEWQRTHNLVARSALPEIWTRHVADSLQLVPQAGAFQEWVDLGSGAGFPGAVAAIALADQGAGHFTLVEANQKKAAFLRVAVREAGANASVVAQRAEQHGPTMAGQADVVSARALAGLHELCTLAFPYLHDASVLLLLKGRDFVHEQKTAAKSWTWDLEVLRSITDDSGRIVQIRKLRPRR